MKLNYRTNLSKNLGVTNTRLENWINFRIQTQALLSDLTGFIFNIFGVLFALVIGRIQYNIDALSIVRNYRSPGSRIDCLGFLGMTFPTPCGTSFRLTRELSHCILLGWWAYLCACPLVFMCIFRIEFNYVKSSSDELLRFQKRNQNNDVKTFSPPTHPPTDIENCLAFILMLYESLIAYLLIQFFLNKN